MFIFQASICFNEFFSYKTVPTIEKKSLKDVGFPSLYICGRSKKIGQPPYDLEGTDINILASGVANLSTGDYKDLEFIG